MEPRSSACKAENASFGTVYITAALESSLESTLELEAEFDRECYRSVETRQALRDFIKSREK